MRTLHFVQLHNLYMFSKLLNLKYFNYYLPTFNKVPSLILENCSSDVQLRSFCTLNIIYYFHHQLD